MAVLKVSSKGGSVRAYGVQPLLSQPRPHCRSEGWNQANNNGDRKYTSGSQPRRADERAAHSSEMSAHQDEQGAVSPQRPETECQVFSSSPPTPRPPEAALPFFSYTFQYLAAPRSSPGAPAATRPPSPSPPVLRSTGTSASSPPPPAPATEGRRDPPLPLLLQYFAVMAARHRRDPPRPPLPLLLQYFAVLAGLGRFCLLLRYFAVLAVFRHPQPAATAARHCRPPPPAPAAARHCRRRRPGRAGRAGRGGRAGPGRAGGAAGGGGSGGPGARAGSAGGAPARGGR